MDEMDEKLREIARRHGVGESVVAVLADGLRRSGGRQVQFSHPDLGGMGQWMPGMIMIGDMFNPALKARVDALCHEIAAVLAAEPEATARSSSPMVGESGRWWPEALGTPSATGGQNEVRYAYFAAANRLAIAQGGAVAVYDTDGHRITGVSQQQASGGASVVVFTGQEGPVALDALRRVG